MEHTEKQVKPSFRSMLAPFLFGSVLSVVRLFVGLIRIKYIAYFFGTIGVGIIAQGNQLQLLGISLVSLSMSTGMIQRILSAQRENDPSRESRILPTAFTVQLILSVVLTIVFLLFRTFFSEYLFGSNSYKTYIMLVVISVPLYTFSSGYLEALFFGLSKYNLYIKANVWSTILSFLFFPPLAYFYGVKGIFISYVVSSAVHFVCYLFYVSRLRPLPQLFKLGFHWDDMVELMRHSSVMLLVGIASYAVPIFIRSIVIRNFGLSVNGVLQVPIALSAYYAPFLTNLMWGRLHTKVSSIGDHQSARIELFTMLQFIVSLQAGIVIFLMMAPGLLIRLIYTKDFSQALTLMPLQFLGDYFYFIVLTCSVYVLGVRRLKLYLALWTLYYVCFIVLSHFTIARMGVQSIPFSHLIASALTLVPTFLWLVRYFHDRVLLHEACILFFLGAILVATQAWLLYNNKALLFRGLVMLVYCLVTIFLFWKKKVINFSFLQKQEVR